ncbi:MAG: tripartite tricarboxylate transporter substrate binding protein [Proteobacteria bacterium]|jgi:tripartite-type tricarboxylate transporter receptor subunit TctC|nr:MAG: tripartite tricarboxylate transporter substrate binding protein [Pseudomonadota bacterium]
MIARRAVLAGLGSLALSALVAAPGALAQSYPTRPVQLIVPWAAGGGSDTVARIIAAGLEKELGQPVNVVNRTGGNGMTGHSAIATATPDGYTLGLATSEIASYKVLGLGDITPESFDLISRVTTIPAGITVKADGPYKTAQDVLDALKKAKKDELSASGTGTGGAWHLAVAGLNKALGLPADHVKYVPSQGGAPALNELAAGGLSFLAVSPIEAKALAEGGRVKVLAVMDTKRLSSFPDVPTLKEATGLDWTFVNWFGLVLPKGVPADIRAKLIEACAKAHARPEVQDALKARGITPVWETPEEFKEFAMNFSKMATELLTDLGLAKQ